MIANVFSVDRFDGVSGVRPGQASKSVAPNGVNPFAVRDTVSFSAEALGLAQGMGLAQNGAADFTVSRSAGETADPASGAATNAALQKKFHRYLLDYLTSAAFGWEAAPGNTLALPGEDSAAGALDARNTKQSDAASGGMDDEDDADENGIEAKIKKLTAKMEQIYASDMPDPAKDAAAKVNKKPIDELLAQQTAPGRKEQGIASASAMSSRTRSGKA